MERMYIGRLELQTSGSSSGKRWSLLANLSINCLKTCILDQKVGGSNSYPSLFFYSKNGKFTKNSSDLPEEEAQDHRPASRTTNKPIHHNFDFP